VYGSHISDMVGYIFYSDNYIIRKVISFYTFLILIFFFRFPSITTFILILWNVVVQKVILLII